MDASYKTIIIQVMKHKMEEKDLKDDMVLMSDLKFDSLTFVSMIVLLESTYGFSFDDEYISVEKLNTVKDVGDYVNFKIAQVNIDGNK